MAGSGSPAPGCVLRPGGQSTVSLKCRKYHLGGSKKSEIPGSPLPAPHKASAGDGDPVDLQLVDTARLVCATLLTEAARASESGLAQLSRAVSARRTAW